MKKIIIIGGGYAGIRAMQRLKGVSDIEIILFDIQAYQYLQTEAYAIIANTANITHVTVDLPSLCKYNENAQFIRKKITSINFENKFISSDKDEYSYDYLIIASGSYTNFPKVVNGLKENSVGIKNLKNAFFIKQKFAKQLYELMSRDKPRNDKFFNIVIGGAGLSGVEIAAQMASKTKEFLRLNHIPDYGLNIYLISSSDCVLPGMDKYLQDNSLKRLKSLGVNVILNTRIKSVKPNIVYLNDESTIDFNYMIFTGGVTTSYYIKELNNCDLTSCGRLIVEDTMQLKGYDDVFAIGDVAVLKDKNNKIVAATAHAAEQSAQTAAKNIKNLLNNKKVEKKCASSDGVLVALGSNNASVVLFDKFKCSGYLGYWLKWLITWNYKRTLDKNAKKIYEKA